MFTTRRNTSLRHDVGRIAEVVARFEQLLSCSPAEMSDRGRVLLGEPDATGIGLFSFRDQEDGP